MDNTKTHTHHGIIFLFITVVLLITCANSFAQSESLTDPNIQKTITVRHIDPNIAAKVVDQIIKLKIFQLPKETLIIPNRQGKMLTVMTETTGQMKLIEEIVENIDFQIKNEGEINKINIPVANLIFDEFYRIISPLLSKEGRLSYNITAHILVVTEITENLKNIENFVIKLDSYDFVDPNSIPDAGVIDIPNQADVNSIETKAADINEPMVAVQFSGFKIEQITERLKQWTGKEVIPSQEAMNIRLTVYSPEKMKRSEAIKLLYSAMMQQGFTTEEIDNTIYIKPTPSTGDRIDIVAAEDSLENIPNKDMKICKIFKLKFSSPSIMGQLILPYLSSSGYFTAYDSTKSLMVGDTVKNLIRIEQIISIFDSDPNNLPKGGVIYPVDPNKEIAEPNISKNYQLKYIKPSEMKQIIEPLISKNGHIDANDETKILLIADDPKTRKSLENIIEYFDIENASFNKQSELFVDPNVEPREIIQIINQILKQQADPNSPNFNRTTGRTSRIKKQADSNSVPKDDVINTNDPNENAQKQETYKEIRELLQVLDIEPPQNVSPYDTISIKHADLDEVIEYLLTFMQGMEMDFPINVPLQTLSATKQILVFGKKDFREDIKKIVALIDTPESKLQRKVFQLKNANAEELKTKVYEVFGNNTSGKSKPITISEDMLITIANPSLKQLVILTSKEKMEKIEKQILIWDSPIDF